MIKGRSGGGRGNLTIRRQITFRYWMCVEPEAQRKGKERNLCSGKKRESISSSLDRTTIWDREERGVK